MRTVLVTAIVFAVTISLTIAQEYFYLQLFFAALAGTVFVMGFRANSLMFLFLGTLLFTRFYLENYQYEWSPIGQLAAGHLAISIVVYLAVRGEKNIWLMCLPVLIFLQFVCDASYLALNYDRLSYIYPHNALALMQMSAFMVMAYDRRKRPVIKDDPIEELISRLTRNWANVWLPWKNNYTV